jgi:hypothetical protein
MELPGSLFIAQQSFRVRGNEVMLNFPRAVKERLSREIEGDMPEKSWILFGKGGRALLGLLLFTLLLTACFDKPLPADKKSYAGEWQGAGMTLIITDAGRIKYKRVKGRVTTEIDSPIAEFQGNDFTVGLAPVITTFKVTKPPYQDDGQWKMVVDGLELIRTP